MIVRGPFFSPTHGQGRDWMSTNVAAVTSRICHGSLTALINSWSLIHPAQSCSATIKQMSSLTHRRSSQAFWQHVSFSLHFITPLMHMEHSLPSLQTIPVFFFQYAIMVTTMEEADRGSKSAPMTPQRPLAHETTCCLEPNLCIHLWE